MNEFTREEVLETIAEQTRKSGLPILTEKMGDMLRAYADSIERVQPEPASADAVPDKMQDRMAALGFPVPIRVIYEAYQCATASADAFDFERHLFRAAPVAATSFRESVYRRVLDTHGEAMEIWNRLTVKLDGTLAGQWMQTVRDYLLQVTVELEYARDSRDSAVAALADAVAEHDRLKGMVRRDEVIRDSMDVSKTRVLLELSQAVQRAEKAEAELAEMESTFDLRWKADMRAIEQWRAAHPGNDMTWPSHDDLCIWLMAERDALRARIEGAPFVTMSRADVCAWDVPDSWSGKRVRLVLESDSAGLESGLGGIVKMENGE